jgi:hypothetical protein
MVTFDQNCSPKRALMVSYSLSKSVKVERDVWELGGEALGVVLVYVMVRDHFCVEVAACEYTASTQCT